MVPTQEGSVLYLCTSFEADILIHPKVIMESQNLEIGSRDPGHSHLGGYFMVRTHERSILYLCTKFEADSLIHSKVITVQKFGNRVS